MSPRFSTPERGPFDLDVEAGRFGGWPRFGDAVAIAFPVEGWRSSAVVLMRQRGNRTTGGVRGADEADAERAWRQALATVSLDVDGEAFVEIGRRDPIIGRLAAEYGNLRPVLFHSPYEAACAFIIGHRISILQTRRIRKKVADDAGATIEVDGTAFTAFPDPHALLRLDSFPSVAPPKVERLHQVARTALEGTLDRVRALQPSSTSGSHGGSPARRGLAAIPDVGRGPGERLAAQPAGGGQGSPPDSDPGNSKVR